MQNSKNLPIISSIENLKFLPGVLSENEIIDLLSDIKHRVFPRPFERLGVPRGGGGKDYSEEKSVLQVVNMRCRY